MSPRCTQMFRRIRPTSLSWPLAALCVLLMIGLCTAAAAMLAQLRADAWRSAQRGAENILQTVSADIARNVELFDLSLQSVVDGLRTPGLVDLSLDLRRAVLYDRAATAQYLGSILVLNEYGIVIDDAGTVPLRPGSLADREYFQMHRDNPGLGLFISAPFRRRVTGDGDMVVALSRRLEHADGSFAGVVVGTLRIDYFRDLFDYLDLGLRGAITLVRTDGTVMVRSPYNAAQVGRSLNGAAGMRRFAEARSGTFQVTAVLDGVPRIGTFTHIGDLPLVLAVSFSEADIYSAWYGRAAVIAGVLAVLCATVGSLALLFSREIKRRARAEADMRASEAQFRLLADHATDVIARFDRHLVCRYVSPSCRTVLGYDAREMVGAPAGAAVHPVDWAQVEASVEAAQRKGGHCAVTYRMTRKDGRVVWVEGHYSHMAEDGGFTVVLRDVDARKEAEQELEAVHAELTRLASTDALTGIANRRRFDEALHQEWRRAAREEQPLTLLLLDVDRFKLFNDRYGHQAGDACLYAVAQAVAGCALRPADLVARYGGEEIAVLLPDTDADSGALLGERVRAAIARLALQHAGNQAHGGIVTASIGVVTVIPPRSDMATYQTITSPAALVAAADRMLYDAKRLGRNRIETHEAVSVPPEVQAWFEPQMVS